MPIDKITLDKIKANIDKAKAAALDMRTTLANMRKAGINAADHEAKLKELEGQIRQMETFYIAESTRK
jgi:hypothetical protein